MTPVKKQKRKTRIGRRAQAKKRRSRKTVEQTDMAAREFAYKFKKDGSL
jgi:hypothetical protein